ncbi:unnamed protein product [Pipistrellus nathusii]|uniref:Secreted protein n=1 Tax=Pipistrellus nathusii TaxID=59473 RepID=A0ABN9ZEV0_PIPNA
MIMRNVWSECHQPKACVCVCVCVCVCDVSLPGDVTKPAQLCCWCACRPVSEGCIGRRVLPPAPFPGPSDGSVSSNAFRRNNKMEGCVDLPHPVPPLGNSSPSTVQP